MVSHNNVVLVRFFNSRHSREDPMLISLLVPEITAQNLLHRVSILTVILWLLGVVQYSRQISNSLGMQHKVPGNPLSVLFFSVLYWRFIHAWITFPELGSRLYKVGYCRSGDVDLDRRGTARF